MHGENTKLQAEIEELATDTKNIEDSIKQMKESADEIKSRSNLMDVVEESVNWA